MGRGNRTNGKYGEIKNLKLFGHEYGRADGPCITYKLSPKELEQYKYMGKYPSIKEEESVSKLRDLYPDLQSLLASIDGKTLKQWEEEHGMTNSNFYQLKKKYEAEAAANKRPTKPVPPIKQLEELYPDLSTLIASKANITDDQWTIKHKMDIACFRALRDKYVARGDKLPEDPTGPPPDNKDALDTSPEKIDKKPNKELLKKMIDNGALIKDIKVYFRYTCNEVTDLLQEHDLMDYYNEKHSSNNQSTKPGQPAAAEPQPENEPNICDFMSSEGRCGEYLDGANRSEVHAEKYWCLNQMKAAGIIPPTDWESLCCAKCGVFDRCEDPCSMAVRADEKPALACGFNGEDGTCLSANCVNPEGQVEWCESQIKGTGSEVPEHFPNICCTICPAFKQCPKPCQWLDAAVEKQTPQDPPPVTPTTEFKGIKKPSKQFLQKLIEAGVNAKETSSYLGWKMSDVASWIQEYGLLLVNTQAPSETEGARVEFNNPGADRDLDFTDIGQALDYLENHCTKSQASKVKLYKTRTIVSKEEVPFTFGVVVHAGQIT